MFSEAFVKPSKGLISAKGDPLGGDMPGGDNPGDWEDDLPEEGYL